MLTSSAGGHLHLGYKSECKETAEIHEECEFRLFNIYLILHQAVCFNELRNIGAAFYVFKQYFSASF